VNAPAAALATTRVEAAMRGLTAAFGRIERFESEGDAAFAQLHAAQEAAGREGIAADYAMLGWVAAGYSEWKRTLALHEAAEIAHTEMTR
jgi:hypothetical protein